MWEVFDFLAAMIAISHFLVSRTILICDVSLDPRIGIDLEGGTLFRGSLSSLGEVHCSRALTQNVILYMAKFQRVSTLDKNYFCLGWNPIWFPDALDQ